MNTYSLKRNQRKTEIHSHWKLLLSTHSFDSIFFRYIQLRINAFCVAWVHCEPLLIHRGWNCRFTVRPVLQCLPPTSVSRQRRAHWIFSATRTHRYHVRDTPLALMSALPKCSTVRSSSHRYMSIIAEKGSAYSGKFQ